MTAFPACNVHKLYEIMSMRCYLLVVTGPRNPKRELFFHIKAAAADMMAQEDAPFRDSKPYLIVLTMQALLPLRMSD
jgi:hypothetical protein